MIAENRIYLAEARALAIKAGFSNNVGKLDLMAVARHFGVEYATARHWFYGRRYGLKYERQQHLKALIKQRSAKK